MGHPEAQKFDHPYNVVTSSRQRQVRARAPHGQPVPVLVDSRPSQRRFGPADRSYLALLALRTGSASDATPGVRVVRTSEGRVQCDSCHDPHDNGSAPFLRAPAQDLCFICHDR
jgi:predicted CXXCH cytochrome family protein